MKKPAKGWGQREGFPEEMWLGLKTEKCGEINQGKKGKGIPDGRRPVCMEWGWKKQRREAWAAAEVGATMLCGSPIQSGLVFQKQCKVSAAFKQGADVIRSGLS